MFSWFSSLRALNLFYLQINKFICMKMKIKLMLSTWQIAKIPSSNRKLRMFPCLCQVGHKSSCHPLPVKLCPTSRRTPCCRCRRSHTSRCPSCCRPPPPSLHRQSWPSISCCPSRVCKISDQTSPRPAGPRTPLRSKPGSCNNINPSKGESECQDYLFQ